MLINDPGMHNEKLALLEEATLLKVGLFLAWYQSLRVL
jgi:hypothetical protein